MSKNQIKLNLFKNKHNFFKYLEHIRFPCNIFKRNYLQGQERAKTEQIKQKQKFGGILSGTFRVPGY